MNRNCGAIYNVDMTRTQMLCAKMLFFSTTENQCTKFYTCTLHPKQLKCTQILSVYLLVKITSIRISIAQMDVINPMKSILFSHFEWFCFQNYLQIWYNLIINSSFFMFIPHKYDSKDKAYNYDCLNWWLHRNKKKQSKKLTS